MWLSTDVSPQALRNSQTLSEPSGFYTSRVSFSAYYINARKKGDLPLFNHFAQNSLQIRFLPFVLRNRKQVKLPRYTFHFDFTADDNHHLWLINFNTNFCIYVCLGVFFLLQLYVHICQGKKKTTTTTTKLVT